jgi:hypothetical protein
MKCTRHRLLVVLFFPFFFVFEKECFSVVDVSPDVNSYESANLSQRATHIEILKMRTRVSWKCWRGQLDLSTCLQKKKALADLSDLKMKKNLDDSLQKKSIAQVGQLSDPQVALLKKPSPGTQIPHPSSPGLAPFGGGNIEGQRNIVASPTSGGQKLGPQPSNRGGGTQTGSPAVHEEATTEASADQGHEKKSAKSIFGKTKEKGSSILGKKNGPLNPGKSGPKGRHS